MCYGMNCIYEDSWSGSCHFYKYFPEDAACMQPYQDAQNEQEEPEEQEEDIEEPSNKN